MNSALVKSAPHGDFEKISALVESMPQGDFEEISALMDSWRTKFQSRVSQKQPIRFDMSCLERM